MKFSNPILNCERKDGRTDKVKLICPYNFSKVGGIKIVHWLSDKIHQFVTPMQIEQKKDHS